MNLRNVLKVYSILRQFNDDEAALLKTLQSLNDTERELLVESLSPQRSASKKRVASKASRSTSQRRGMPTTTVVNSALPCGHIMESNGRRERCGAIENDPIHFANAGYAAYHPFSPGASSAAKTSSPNGEGEGSTPSSETVTGNAGHAAHAGGD